MSAQADMEADGRAISEQDIQPLPVLTVRKGVAVTLSYPDGIEPGILPVCDALNSASGVKTLWSCHGHPEYEERVPLVVFLSSQEFALRVHRLLKSRRSATGLEYSWALTGEFRDGGDLQWMIKTTDARIRGGNIFRRWSRSAMDDELRLLAKLLSALHDPR